jgi:hypothetical protein
VPVSRRTLVGALGTLVSGCGSRPDVAERASPTATATRAASTRTSPPSGGGDEAADAAARAVGSVTVVNDGTDRYVTVVVESGAGTHHVESRTVRGGTGVTFDGVVPGPGRYRVVVDTASGPRGTFDWAVVPPLDRLRIRLADGVTFARPLTCDPDCPPVALGGRATGYPEGGFDPRGRRAGSTLRVHNAAGTAREVRVRVADGSILDYRYRIPPAVTLVVPVPQRAGETTVRIDVDDGETETFAWAMETDPVRRVVVGRAA